MPDINVIDATAELKMLRFLDDYAPPFDVIGTYRLIDDGVRPEATVTLRAGDQEMHEADLGVGPVDALANVLKKSLGQLFPAIPKVRLLDFKVRLIEGNIGTSAQIEVNIAFSDGKTLWRVSSVDDNVNLASFHALLDGYEYAIYLWGKGRAQGAGRGAKGQPKAQSPSPSAKASGDKKPKAKAASPKTRRRGDTETRGKGKPKAQSSKPKAKAESKPIIAAKAKPKAAVKTKTKAKPEVKSKKK